MYWKMVETKREKANEFINYPSRQTFEELVNPEYFWATRAWGSLDYYLDEYVFAENTPRDVATTIERAAETGSVEDTLALGGFGWPVATEILRALEPDKFAILNKRAVSGVKALGYSPPNPKSASVEQYAAFVEDVRDAAEHYNIREIADTTTVNEIPSDATDLEIADAAFYAHSEGEVDLSEARETTVEQPSIPAALVEQIQEVVGDDPRYRDKTDFLYSAIRNELDRSR